jgi:chemotaxis protein MotA
MDVISIAGLLIGLAAVVVGQVLEGGRLSSLIQPTAFLIVVGGTVGAVMLQSRSAAFFAGVGMGKWIFFPPHIDAEAIIERVVVWSNISRKEGMLMLENQIEYVEDPFEQKGLQMLVDAVEPEELGEALDIEIAAYEKQLKLACKVWESAGGYSPTIGILGAVLGLIHVMENLAEPSKLGGGIAVAFVATIYGVGLANLVFLPVAKKLQTIVGELAGLREMYVDGLLAIANGVHPRLIVSRMRAHLS